MKKHIPKEDFHIPPENWNAIRYVSHCGRGIRSRDVGDFRDPDLCGSCARIVRPKRRPDRPPLRRPEGYQKYKLGNFLRGFFEGYFKDTDTAWKYLSHRFFLSYPGRRHVYMETFGENRFGFEEFMLCRKGLTEEQGLHFGTAMRLTRKSL